MDIISKLKQKADRRHLTLKIFWTNIPKISFENDDTAITYSVNESNNSCEVSGQADGAAVDAISVTDCLPRELVSNESVEVPKLTANIPRSNFEKPAQNAVKQTIDLLNADLTGLYKRQSHGILTLEQQKELKKSEKRKNILEKPLQKKNQTPEHTVQELMKDVGQMCIDM